MKYKALGNLTVNIDGKSTKFKKGDIIEVEGIHPQLDSYVHPLDTREDNIKNPKYVKIGLVEVYQEAEKEKSSKKKE